MDVKNSKKGPYEDSRMTLNAIDAKTIDKFNNYYKTLDDKKLMLTQLNRKKQGFRNKYSNEYFDLLKSIKKLEEEIDNISNKRDEINYLIKAAPHFLEYCNTFQTKNETETKGSKDEAILNFKKDKNFIIKEGTNRGQICNNYIKQCIGDGFSLSTKSSELDITQELTCMNCGVEKVINIRESTASCTMCGEVSKYQDSQNNKGEYSEEVEVLSPFAYKRINHFKEWLNSLSGNEGSGPPEHVLIELLYELKKDRVETREEVTEERIKGYLKKLGYSKLYYQTPSIIYKLCGTEPPKISRELQEKLIKMFEEIQLPFEKNSPEDRCNFLSYSYVLHKFCQLLQQNHLLPKLHLLKSREKLYQQDLTWRKICSEKNWKFFPSL
jgi:hypothetical protein